jgi:hypothetical protein
LVVAGVRYFCNDMAIRWWTILYIITIFVLVLLCCKVGHFSSFSIDVTLFSLLLNDKEFCFSLICLNSIFSTLPQSEYTSRAVSTPHVRYIRACVYFCLLSIVYSVFQRCPTRDEISFPVGQSNCKKRSKIFKFQTFFKNFI